MIQKHNDLSEERKTRELVGFKGRSSHVSCGSEKTSGRDGPGEDADWREKPVQQVRTGGAEGSPRKWQPEGVSMYLKDIPQQKTVLAFQHTACSPESVNTISMASRGIF